MKTCRKCNERKRKAEFYKDRSQKDGLTTSCAECQKKRSNDYYRNNIGQRRKANRERYEPAKPHELICQNCKSIFRGTKNTKYCSVKCRNQKGYQRNKGKFKFICKGCGKTAFATAHNRQNYCTHRCYSDNAPHLKHPPAPRA